MRFLSRLATPLAVVVGVSIYGWFRAPRPREPGSLRVVTWNLRNFPAPGQDVAAMRDQVEALDAEIVAVQEVRDEAALQSLAPEYRYVLSRGGGHHGQRLGVLYDPERVELLTYEEIDAVAVKDTLRPALAVEFVELTVVVVHLKALRSGIEIRRKQWAALTDAIGSPKRLVVLGDFNSTGGEAGPAAELVEIGSRLGPLGLNSVPTPGGCTSYWDGPRRDAWFEPSRLDLIWVSSGFEAVGSVHGRCAVHACQPHRSRSMTSTSDHCPVSADLVEITPPRTFES